MVPMHGRNGEGAFHEPWLVWSSAFRRLEPFEPAEAGTPSAQRLQGRNSFDLRKGAFHEPGSAGVSPASWTFYGSWSQCMRKKRKGAFHEPYPLTLSLSPNGGEGVRRTGEGDRHRFKVPMHPRKRKGAFHEPWFGVPPSGGLNRLVRVKPGLQTSMNRRKPR